MLKEQFPEVSFDVINVAVTAINSHVVVEVARDCAERDPDLLIVLLGNNEVIGPYGPTFTFGDYSASRRPIRMSLWAQSTRVGQLVGNLAKAFRDTPEPSEWQGMRTFLKHRLSPNDPKLKTVYEHFQANLIDICRAAQNADARVLLATVPVNLRDCAPFGSSHRPGLSDGELDSWTAAYDEGARRQQAGDFAGAIEQLLAAESIDDQYADLHFRLARSYLALDQLDDARQRFALALHWDTLRFRADGPINDVIRQVAGDRQDAGVSLLDAERLFAEADATVADSPGRELFYEHVHFNFDGQYMLARAMFDQVVAFMPDAVRARQSETTLPSPQQCAEMLALTDWDRRRNLINLARMVVVPPFTGQLTNRETRQQIALDMRHLRARTTMADLAVAAEAYDLAIQAAPENPWMRHHAGQLAMARGDNVAAIGHLKKTLSLVPGNTEAYLHLGLAYLRLGNYADAKLTFAEYLKESWSTVSAYRIVIDTYNGVSLFDEAEAYCRRGLKKHPDNAVLLNMLGETLYRAGELDQAIEALSQALQVDPEYAMAQASLGTALVANGQVPQGLEQLAAALERDPSLDRAHFSLGLTQIQMGQLELGFSHLAEAVRLDSENDHMVFEFARLLQLHGRLPGAVAGYGEVLSINPRHGPAAGRLAWILATSNDPALRNPSEAIRLAQLSIELSNGRLPQAWTTLAAAYAADGQFDQAIEAANRALALATETGQQPLVQQIQRHLTRYRQGEALTESPAAQSG